jgi:hypothetical protein
MSTTAHHRGTDSAATAPRLHAFAVVCALLAFLFTVDAALAERRVALVIGNAQYKNASLVLTNPKNDADDVAAVLRDLGFEVIHAVDATKRDFDLALAKFARLATGADAALFFYAGHALQFQGRNYLMPTDAELEDDVSLRFQMESIEDVRSALDRASGVKIMILDACRNNPMADRLQRKIYGESRALNQTRGLARIDRAQGVVVAYATAADQVAMDGSGRNSPYTTALLKRLREPGLEIEMMFRRIAADVNAQTNGQQRPETYVSLISEYYLNQKDRAVWEGIKSVRNPDTLRDFVELYPTSVFAAEARTRISALEQAARQQQAAQDAQRQQVAALERQRQEREAAQKRAEDEQRARAEAERQAREQEQERQRVAALERERAAALERERQEREAARVRAEEEQRAKAELARKLQEQEQERQRVAALERERVTALERERQERTAAEKRAEDEQRAKAEAARKAQEEERLRIAALEREGQQREAAQRQDAAQRREAEERARAAAAAAAEQQRQQLAAVPPPAAQPTATTADACKRDEERLARLRAAPERDEVIRFARELGCDRLRAQVARLRESVGDTTTAAAQPLQPGTAHPPAPVQPTATRAAPPPAAPAQQQVTARDQPAHQAQSLSPEQACKQDAERLVRLRASRSLEDITKFIRELSCEKLRPQVLRLRESVEAR